MAENIETIANETSELFIREIQTSDGSVHPIIDTKNTTGASEFQEPGSLHLIGATSKGEEEITYTKSGVHIHVTEDGLTTLYSPGFKCETSASTAAVVISPGRIMTGTTTSSVTIDNRGGITADGIIQAGTTTSGVRISSNGTIVATSNITTGTTTSGVRITAGGDIVATGIISTTGDITTGTTTEGVTISADGFITATGAIATGCINTPLINVVDEEDKLPRISLNGSDGSISADGSITTTNGNISTYAGNISTNVGDIFTKAGSIKAYNIIAGTTTSGVTISGDGSIKTTTLDSEGQKTNVEISASGITTRGYIKSTSSDTDVEISPSYIRVVSTSASAPSYSSITPDSIVTTGNIYAPDGIIRAGISTSDYAIIAANGTITATNYISTGTTTSGVTISSNGNINATGTITTSRITVSTISATGDISATGNISTARTMSCGYFTVPSGTIQTGTTTSGVTIGANGIIAATGTITAQAFYESSDERLKTFTEDYDINLDDIKNIRTGKFYWNADENQNINGGVSAQTVEQYFPELVKEDENGMKSVNYDGLAVVAIAAIKKLTAKVEELEDIIRNK